MIPIEDLTDVTLAIEDTDQLMEVINCGDVWQKGHRFCPNCYASSQQSIPGRDSTPYDSVDSHHRIYRH